MASDTTETAGTDEAPAGPLDVQASRTFAAPVEEVWRAWSDPAYLAGWWGPTGFTCPRADVDFREGGVTLVVMRAPAEYGGQDMFNTWSYTRIVPRERIEFVMHFADEHGTAFDPATTPGLPPGIPFGVPHVITFTTRDPATTEMTLIERGYTTAEARDTSKAGLDQTLDKLAAMLAAPPAG